jgi:hypothetical protein
MLNQSIADVALEGRTPRWLAWPHIVSRLGNSFLPALRGVLQPRFIGLWPRSPLYDLNGEPADTFENCLLSSWAHPKNQAALTKTFYVSSPFFVLDAANDESRIKRVVGHLVQDQWEFKVHPISVFDSILEELGWAGVSFYPDNMLLLLAALPQNEFMVKHVEQECHRQTIPLARFMIDSESKIILEQGEEILRDECL